MDACNGNFCQRVAAHNDHALQETVLTTNLTYLCIDGLLWDRDALTGKGRLVNQQVARVPDDSIRRHNITRFQL